MTNLSTVVHNERVKLTATWFNGVAVALLAVSGFAPLFTVLYGDRSFTSPLILGVAGCLFTAPHYIIGQDFL